jgi:ubiquinone/menaquinone biosynthesis C-methylase UbiE
MTLPTSSLRNPRTSVLSALMAAAWGEQGAAPRLLVVGCGRGIEAAVLAQDLGAEVVGIDIEQRFDPRAAARVTLQQGDAMALAFDDASFDIVYSFHALEHITDPHRALSEMHRVLRPGGLWCIGTPNRARLVGYVGGNSTWKQKLAWNWADWRMRLRGRFRNEFGAHAGYTSAELGGMLSRHFSTVDEITQRYYQDLYRRRPGLVRLLNTTGLGRVAYPSVYFIGRR